MEIRLGSLQVKKKKWNLYIFEKQEVKLFEDDMMCRKS